MLNRISIFEGNFGGIRSLENGYEFRNLDRKDSLLVGMDLMSSG